MGLTDPIVASDVSYSHRERVCRKMLLVGSLSSKFPVPAKRLGGTQPASTRPIMRHIRHAADVKLQLPLVLALCKRRFEVGGKLLGLPRI